MWNSTRSVAPVLALAFLAACDAATSTEPVDEPVEFVSEEAIAATASAEIGAAGDHAGLATSLPGFGGFWFDRRCNLNVVLTDVGNPELTIETLTPLLRRKLELQPRCPDDATIILHRGDFTWVELSRWAAELGAAGIRGVAGVGVNVPLNRVIVGVPNRRVAHAVLDAAARLSVPPRAIKFRLAGGGAGGGRR